MLSKNEVLSILPGDIVAYKGEDWIVGATWIDAVGTGKPLLVVNLVREEKGPEYWILRFPYDPSSGDTRFYRKLKNSERDALKSLSLSSSQSPLRSFFLKAGKCISCQAKNCWSCEVSKSIDHRLFLWNTVGEAIVPVLGNKIVCARNQMPAGCQIVRICVYNPRNGVFWKLHSLLMECRENQDYSRYLEAAEFWLPRILMIRVKSDIGEYPYFGGPRLIRALFYGKQLRFSSNKRI
jgi:hypothetical protein